MTLYKCTGIEMTQVTYDELADYALNGEDFDGIACFLDCDAVLEAADAMEALNKFQKYLKDMR